MSVNLITIEPLNNFLSGFIQAIPCSNPPTLRFANNGKLKTKSVQQVERSKEYIAKAMVERYFDHRVKAFLLSDKRAPYFEKIGYSDYMEDWAKKRLNSGGDVYVFCKTKVPDELVEEIEIIRDFLYHSALKRVEEKIELFNKTQKKDKEITINLDTLKTTNEYSDFESLLKAAKNGDVYKHKAAEFLRESVQDTQQVMTFKNGMRIVKLNSKVALNFEGKQMSHCVADGEYDQEGNKQKIEIFSLRDDKGRPHVTIELRDGTLTQCKAYDNQKPKDSYLPYIREFVKLNDLPIGADMKYLGMFKQDGKYYTYDNLPKGFVYKGVLDLSGCDLRKLPNMSHIEVTGSFVCENNKLTSLVGAPRKVGGNVFTRNNPFKTLKGAPEYVGGDFYCTYAQIEDLSGAPKVVEGDFNCMGNEITSLRGAPEYVGGNFNCSNNMLEDLDCAPREVGGNFNCSHNSLTTLKGAPNKVGGDFDCSHNKLHSLEYLPEEIGGEVVFHHNLIIVQNGQEYDLNNFPRDVKILGNLDLSGMGLTKLPDLSGVEVEGDFNCSGNMLESLEGAPEKVGGDFNCSRNKLNSIIGAPKEIGGDFILSNNNIEILGALPKVKGVIHYEANPLVRDILESKRATYRDIVARAIMEEKRGTLSHLDLIDNLMIAEKSSVRRFSFDVARISHAKESKLK